jgi:hypothetical protein
MFYGIQILPLTSPNGSGKSGIVYNLMMVLSFQNLSNGFSGWDEIHTFAFIIGFIHDPARVLLVASPQLMTNFGFVK